MTPEEIAAKDVGCDEKRLAEIVRYAEQRGFHRGRKSLEGAVEHFECAYRYAVNAKERIGKTGPDGEAEPEYVNDAFESANIMAGIAYKEWLGKDWPHAIDRK
jgi:hypothetical protein